MSKSLWSRSVWNSLFSRVASRRPARRRKALTKHFDTNTAAELLEQRIVPTLSVSYAAATGILTLTGDAGSNDAVTVRAGASYTDVSVNGVFTARVNNATSTTINTINFTGDTGTDTLAISGTSKSITVGLTGVEKVSLTSTKSASVTADGGIALGVSAVSGDLTVSTTAAGNITQFGKLSVSGTASFTTNANAGDITLTTAGNSFGTVKVGGTAVQVVESGSTDLGASTVLGALTVTSSGAITDSGALAVTGVTTLTATRNAITLDTSTSTFGNDLVLTGTNVAVTDSDAATSLGKVSATGTLSITASGPVTQTGTTNVNGGIYVGGLMTITATNQDVTLLENGDVDVINNFGSISIIGKDVQLKERSSSVLAKTTTTGLLSLTAGGAVTDSGDVVVATKTTISTGGTITLDQADSQFNGAVKLSGSNIAITNSLATILDDITASGTFGLTSGGAVTEIATGNAMSVGGRATISAFDPTTLVRASITLTDATADSYGSIGLDGASVSFKETGDTDLYTTTTTGSLTVESTGNITDRGDVKVGTTTSLLVAAGKSITLNSTGSEYTGAITVLATTVAKNVVIVNSLPTGTVLGAITASGTLKVTSGGAVTQTATALSITGRATITATDYNITLDTVTNAFGSLSFDGEDVTIKETSATDLFTSRAKGNFSLTSTGAITDSGTLTIVGSTTLSNGANNITLDSGASTFGGNLIITASQNVSVKDNDLLGLTLGTSALTGTLSITAKGNITDAGGAVTGSAAFNSATFVATNGGDVTLTQTTLAVGAGGTLSITADYATVTMSTPIILGATTLTGALSITTTGAANDITDSGKITVADTVTIDAAGDDVTLNSVGNSFGTVILTNADDVIISESGSTDLGTSGTLATLTVTSTGDITDSGVLTVTGATNLTSNGGSISLIQATSTFGTMSLKGADITVTDAGALDFGTTIASGDLTATATGAVSQTGGTLTVGGLMKIQGAATTVTLTNVANNFGSVAISGTTVSFKEDSDTDLSTTSASSLTVVTTGAITDSGTVTVTGNTDLTAADGDAITLDQLLSTYSGEINLVGSDIALTNNTTTKLGAITATGGLSVTSTGAVSRNTAAATNLSVTDQATIIATGQTIDLTTTGAGTNNFGSIGVTGAAVTITEASATKLETSVVTGNLSVTSSGDVTDNGTLTVTGTTTITAGTNNINLDSSASQFTGSIAVVSAKDVAVTNNLATKLGDMTLTGSLTITSNGNITEDDGTAGRANLVVPGTVIMNAGSNTITLNSTAGAHADTFGTTPIFLYATTVNFTGDADVVAPTVTVTQVSADPTPAATANSTGVIFKVLFNEVVTGFTSADITFSGTAASPVAAVTNPSGDGKTYYVTVTTTGAVATQTIVIVVATGAASDAAGNASAAPTNTDNSITLN